MNAKTHSDHWSLVQTVLAGELSVPLESITPESRLIEDLEVDSLAMANMLVALDDYFWYEPSPEVVSSLRTVGDLCALVTAAGTLK